jgi:hypothetical protein
VPLHLFAERTVSLATVASLFIGVALFGATVFLSQYFQIARAKSPTVSGLLTLPLVFGLVALFMFVTGAGVGGVMQNLVLAVQNTVRVTELGAATSTVSFFRSLGGAMGVSVLGAVLGARSTHLIEHGLARLGPVPGAAGHSTQIPDVRTLPAPVAAVVQSAYGQALGLVFLIAVPFLVIAAVAISAIREVPLRQTLGAPDSPESAGADRPNASTGVGGA